MDDGVGAIVGAGLIGGIMFLIIAGLSNSGKTEQDFFREISREEQERFNRGEPEPIPTQPKQEETTDPYGDGVEIVYAVGVSLLLSIIIVSLILGLSK